MTAPYGRTGLLPVKRVRTVTAVVMVWAGRLRRTIRGLVSIDLLLMSCDSLLLTL